MEEDIRNLQSLRDETVPLRPLYQPYNDQAKALVDAVHSTLNIPNSRPTSIETQKTIVSGFLAAAQRAFSHDQGYIAIASNTNWWSQYPDAGHTIAMQVQKALVNGEYIEQIENTGKRLWWLDEEDKKRSMGLMTTYALNESILHIDGFVEAEFIETGRATVLVGIPETDGQKFYRRQNNRRKPKMLQRDVRKTFGKAYTVNTLEVEGLNTFWQKHPLALPQLGNGVRGYAACATRIFHQGSLQDGGRYYGAWTSMNSSYRLQCTIDDEPVAEIDLNASQPTLFSSMMGMKMEVGAMWEDLYTYALEAVDLNDLDLEDDDNTRRGKIKQVTMELIGTGNSHKRQEADDSSYTFVDGEFARYRNGLVKVVPALHFLDTDYFNGAGYISYHEAQMMTLALHQLKGMGIPAYPVHDCLLVKNSNVDDALNVYRETIRDYIKEEGKGSLDITVPVSIERSGEEKERIVGYYTNS